MTAVEPPRVVRSPGLHLPDPREIGEYLSTIKSPMIKVLDLRHYFHQIPLPESMRRFFGLSIGDRYFRWRVPPMGWSFSPWIAQSISVAMALEASPVDYKCDAERTPAFVEIQDGKGANARVYVTYDNIAFVGNENLVRAWAKRFHEVARRRRLKIKEGSEESASPQELKQGKSVNHLGAQYLVYEGAFAISLSQKLREKWMERANAPLVTNRAVCRLIGQYLRRDSSPRWSRSHSRHDERSCCGWGAGHRTVGQAQCPSR
jgi:hypothetical protein